MGSHDGYNRGSQSPVLVTIDILLCLFPSPGVNPFLGFGLAEAALIAASRVHPGSRIARIGCLGQAAALVVEEEAAAEVVGVLMSLPVEKPAALVVELEALLAVEEAAVAAAVELEALLVEEAAVAAVVELEALLAAVLPVLQLKVFHPAVLQMTNSASWAAAPIMWQPNAM